MSLYLRYSVELRLPESTTVAEIAAIKSSFRVTASDIVQKCSGHFEDDDIAARCVAELPLN